MLPPLPPPPLPLLCGNTDKIIKSFFFRFLSASIAFSPGYRSPFAIQPQFWLQITEQERNWNAIDCVSAMRDGKRRMWVVLTRIEKRENHMRTAIQDKSRLSRMFVCIFGQFGGVVTVFCVSSAHSWSDCMSNICFVSAHSLEARKKGFQRITIAASLPTQKRPKQKIVHPTANVIFPRIVDAVVYCGNVDGETVVCSAVTAAGVAVDRETGEK